MLPRAVLVLFLATVWLSGCIAVPLPTFEQAPYQQEKLPRLEIGKSTRSDVLSGLGEPDAVYGNEQLFLYTKLQTHFVWLVAVGAGYTAEMGVFPGSQTRHFLAAWFDRNNNLSHLEAIPLKETVVDVDKLSNAEQGGTAREKGPVNCFRNGICFADKRGTVLYAPPDVIKPAAASFSENCRLVLFVDCAAACESKSLIDLRSLKMSVDRWPVGPYVPDGYYDVPIREGRHSVIFSGRKKGLFVLREESRRQKVYCKPPNPIYMKLSLSSEADVKETAKPPVSFDVLDETTAQSVIGPRRRLLRRWHSPNFTEIPGH